MMSFRTLLAAAAAAFSLAPAFAHDGHKHATAEGSPIQVTDAYARVSETGSGAVFLAIANMSGADDTLTGAKSTVAERVELHTHMTDANGVMQMVQIEGGIALPDGATHELKRGGDHVMLLGVATPLKDGDSFSLTLVFQTAGEITFDVTVDNARKPGAGTEAMGEMDHSGHGAGHGTGSGG